MSTISVVISAFNEEKKIRKVLDSVRWADEIIVVDNQSSDNTANIAKEYGAKVYQQPNNPMLNRNKNYGFDQATQDWILNLDGDEEITEKLEQEIRNVINQSTLVDGFWIPRKNIIFGKWIQHGLWWPDRQLRLFKRGKGRFPCEHVHEYVAVEGTTATLTEPYVHYNYETVSQFLRKLDTIYTENEVLNIKKKGTIFHWYDAVRMPISDFVKVYFAQQGYKDGFHGLMLAMLQSVYALIVVAKLWEQNGFKEENISLKQVDKELVRAGKEIVYWEKTAQLNEEKHPIQKILIKIKRKYVTTR